MTDEFSLRELMAQIAHERELRMQKEAAIEEAQRLRAIEVERRLETLNGEYGRIDRVLNTTVPREVFEQYQKTIADRLEEIGREFAKIDRQLTSFMSGEELNKRLEALENAELQRVTREVERTEQVARREQERDRGLRNTMAFVGLVATAGGFLLSLIVRLLGVE